MKTDLPTDYSTDLSTDFSEDYKHVPHHGNMFEKEGKLCWWTLAPTAQVGDGGLKKKRAFCPHLWDPAQPLPAPFASFNGNVLYADPSDPSVHPSLGGSPVQTVGMVVLGMYYDIETDTRCIEVRNTPDGRRIALWQENFPLSAVEQQVIACRTTSVEQYEKYKKQAIQAKKAQSSIVADPAIFGGNHGDLC